MNSKVNKNTERSADQSYRKKIGSFFNIWRISIPVVFGLGATWFLLYRDFDKNAVRDIHWSWMVFFWLIMALVLMAIRHLAYMYRIRLLSDHKLNWKKSFQVIMLWEFASSITPSVVGGSAIALFIINKEKINMGRTSAIVMVTALLDELFYIVMVPVMFVVVGLDRLFISDAEFSLFNSSFGSLEIFWIGYLAILFLTSLILYGVFISPSGFKKILIASCRLPGLRKLKHKAVKTGDEIIATSREMTGKPVLFWLKAFGATVFSWTARFWVVNCIIMAVTNVGDHFLLYARQLTMWVILLVTPTPGSSGAAEYFFPVFLNDFIPPGLAPALVLVWRLLSYYPYLLLGALVLPIWLKRVYANKAKRSDKQE